MTYTEKVLADLKAKNPDQPEFIQAATEVLDALAPVVNNDPKYQKTSLLERLVEPERQIMFRIPWVDDHGQVHVNRGYRVPTIQKLQIFLASQNLNKKLQNLQV